MATATALKAPEGAKVPDPPKGINAKLVAVSDGLGWIAKDRNNTQQGFKFTSAETVFAEVRKVCIGLGVDVSADVVEHSFREGKTAAGKPLNFYFVRIAWTFTDADTGQKVGPFHSVGEGMDSGDKAIFKAITGAMKYGLRMKFLIPLGDEPEPDADADDDEPGADAKPTSRTASVAAKVAAQNGKAAPTDRLKAISSGLEALGFKTSAAREVKAKAILGHPFNPAHEADLSALEAWLGGQKNINDAAEVLGGSMEH
jgi:hypothetical protein